MPRQAVDGAGVLGQYRFRGGGGHVVVAAAAVDNAGGGAFQQRGRAPHDNHAVGAGGGNERGQDGCG